MNDVSSFKKPVMILTSLAVVIGLGLGSCYSIDSGDRGVKLRNGAVTSVSEPGFHLKIPVIESVKTISVRTATVHYPVLQAYSRDQQPAKLTASVTYHVSDADVVKIYEQYGDVESLVNRVISRQVPTQIENVFGQFNAITAVQDRTSLIQKLTDSIKKSMKDDPVIIDSVQVENIVFSDAYEKSVESRMQAEVEVQTQQQKLQQEEINAKIAVTRAQGAADSQLAQAKAMAEATRIRGQADADAIKAKATALSQNQNLIELTKAERWDGKLPQTMLPNSAVPFIDAKPTNQ